MDDFARHLPLSQRGERDEATVSSDWRPLIGGTLGTIADLLGSLPVEDWERASLCEGWRVRDVAGHLAWRVGSSTPHLVRTSARAVFREGVSPRRLVDTMARREAEAGPEQLVSRLRRIADDRLAHRGRRNVHELAEVVVHGYDIATALDRRLAFPPSVTGAVALARTVIAPLPVSAVTRARTLTATDAGWSVGRGPELGATAEAIILFLYGRTALPGLSHATPRGP